MDRKNTQRFHYSSPLYGERKKKLGRRKKELIHCHFLNDLIKLLNKYVYLKIPIIFTMVTITCYSIQPRPFPLVVSD